MYDELAGSLASSQQNGGDARGKDGGLCDGEGNPADLILAGSMEFGP